jgi:hypothetical protein
MAQVTPYYDDPRELTYTVGAGGVVGGRLVEAAAGDRVCVAAGALGPRVVGMALYDRAVGEKVAVARGQVLPAVTTAAAVVAGDKLVAQANGTVKSRAAESAELIVGQALESVSAAGGTIRAYIY